MANDNVYGALIDSDLGAAKGAQTLVDAATPAPNPQISAPPAGASVAQIQPAPSNAPSYDQLLDNDSSGSNTALKSSLYAAKDLNPDRQAKVIQLAQKLKLPVDLVNRKYETLAKTSEYKQTNYDTLIADNPKLSEWLSDPNKAAVAKDDLPVLQAHEDLTNQAQEAQSYWQDFKSGLEGSSSGLLLRGKLPDITLPQNAPIVDSLIAQVGGLLGDLPEMVAGGVGGAVAGAPVGGAVGSAVPGIGTLGGIAAGAGYGGSAGAFAAPAIVKKYLIQQYQNGSIKDYSDLVSRVIDIGLEGVKQGTVGAITGGVAGIAEKAIAGTALEGTVAGAATTVGAEIAAMTTAGKAVEGEMPTPRDYLEGALLVGGLHISDAAKSKLISVMDNQQAANAKNFYESLDDVSADSKLKKRLPEAHTDYVSALTRDTGIENVYVAPQALETYFQSKGINPQVALDQMGVLPDYGRAKELGTDVKIPLATIVDKLGNTEHFKGLADDVKFSPDSLSVNEAKQKDSDLKKDLEQQTVAAQETNQDNAQLSNDESAKQVGQTVAQQLEAAGADPRTAQIYEAAFRTLGERTGQDPQELFKRFGININGHETASAETPDGETQVLNQDKQTALNRQTNLGFYSALESEVSKMDFNSMPAKDLEGRLNNIQGIKKEELNYLGIPEFLAGKEKVSKQELLDYIKSNQVDVQEITHADDTQFDKYKLPGGGNYREVLFRLPPDNGAPFKFSADDAEQTNWQSKERASFKQAPRAEVEANPEYKKAHAKLVKEVRKEVPDMKPKAIKELIKKFVESPNTGGTNEISGASEELNAKFKALDTLYKKLRSPYENDTIYTKDIDGERFIIQKSKGLDGKETYELGGHYRTGKKIFDSFGEAISALEHDLSTEKERNRPGIFKSSHFDESNILAHTRLTDRIDSEGKRTLHAEEIQSDWHQEGRKRGYRTDDGSLPEGFRLHHDTSVEGDHEWQVRDKDDKIAGFGKTQEAALSDFQRVSSKQVPDGPLKKTWHEFVLKRLIRMAAEQGYDKVSWSTGEQQADLYPRNDESEKQAMLSGMQGFYDKIIPDFLRKFGKKFGAEVGKTELKSLSLDEVIRNGGNPGILSVHSIEITPQLKEAALNSGFTFFQGGDEAPRGQIRIGDKSINIDLLKDADRSTFLHETGHLYLEVLKSIASDENAPQQIKDDFDTVQKWLGTENGNFEVDHHEQFARGFESYLMEGKAPSEGLRKVFNTMKVWLTNIYKTLRNLNVDLTPEVKGVFDRILATDDEIAKASQQQNYEPLFKEPAKYGLSPEDFAKYQSAIDAAQLSADDQLRSKMMEDIRKEQTEVYKEQRAKVKEQVELEAQQSQTQKARSLLQYDKLPDGSPRPEGTERLKIDRKSLVDQFGEESLKDLKGMYTREGGTDIGVVADMLGYGSPEDMVNDLSASQPYREYVESQTEARMQDLHPDLFGSPEVPDDAMEAIHNDKRAAVMRLEYEMMAKNNPTELKGLIRRAAKRLPTEPEIREQAQNVVNSLNVRDLSPTPYRVAEARHGREAGEHLTNGNFDQFFESKRLQLLNHELYKATVEARDDVQNSLRQFKKMARTDAKLTKSRDLNLVKTAQAILSAFGIGRTDDSPTMILDKIKRYDLDGYASAYYLVNMATAAGSGNYNEISYSRFSDMRDAVKGIWDLARDAKKIEIDGKKVDKESILTELKAKITDFGPSGKRPGYDKAVTTWEKVKTSLLSAKASLRRPEHWVTAMDGGDKGSFRTNIWNPISDGAVRFRTEKERMSQYYLDNVVLPSKDVFSKRPIQAPEIGYTFSGDNELLAALMHTGNESNLSKLLRGRGWGTVDEQNNLDTSKWDSFISRMQREGKLTKAHYDYVQGVWDMYDSIKADSQKAHKRINGYYFDEVTNKSFQTPFGEYKGGYAPAMVDPFIAQDAQLRADQAIIDNEASSLMFPTAGSGFTKSRVEAYAGPLALDLNLIPMQLDKVLRYTYLEPAVKDVFKLINDRDFREHMAGIDSQVISEMLVPWLDRAAKQSVSSPSGTGRAWKAADYIFRKIRGNAGLNAMTLNVVNTFHQTTGLSVVMTKVEPEYIRDAVWTYLRDAKGTHSDIMEKSEYMRTRESSLGNIEGEINSLILHPNKFQEAAEFIKQNSYILQKFTAGAVETVAWTGAYSKGIAEGYSDKEAVRYADAVIRQTQHAAAPEDVARFGTGSPFQRMFTMYFDYFNNKGNLGLTEAGNTVRDVGIKSSIPRLVYLYTAGMAITGMMSAAAYQAANGSLFNQEGDDEFFKHQFMKIFFGGQFNEATALLPVLGPLINTQKLQLSPGIDSLQKAIGAPKAVFEAIEDPEKKGPAIRDTLTLLGMMSGLPAQALSRPIGYAVDAATQRVKVNGPLDYARGLVTGQGPKQ